MEKIIYAIPSGSNNPETLLLAASIRKFAGKFSKNPIWILIPKSDKEISKEYKKQLEEHNAQIISYEIDSVEAKFPFIDFVKAAATAEKLAIDKAELLVWLDDNSLIINEPNDFNLEKNKNLGYRPVHHTLVGSIYDKPIDSFWDLVYKLCEVKTENIFPMKTHVDGNILRAYFNAGFLVVRPKRGLLQKWWEMYKKEYNNPTLQEFYKKNELYIIFIHQAILTGVILSTLDKNEIKELPFEYNYPFHLYLESPIEYRYKNSNDLKTARIYLDKMLEPNMLEKIALQDPFKSWFENKLKSLKKT